MTSPETPRRPGATRSAPPVAYKGEPLDAARGPGLGCFWVQMAVLAVLIVLTPLSVSWNWPFTVTLVLFVVMLLLLLLTGQTMIFLMRLVASERTGGRRRPLASPTPTVGDLEESAPEPAPDSGADAADAAGAAGAADGPPGPGADPPGMRQ